ncbi:MAG: AI-2E family transporter, partial [Cellulomonadaceae bacterium]|nr:AI-2E family transporter [Cellulomonadaceae bacterium]
MSQPVLDSVPRSVQLAAAWAWRLIAIVLALAAVVTAMAYGKVIWVPVAIALLLTVLLRPVVEVLVRRARLPRIAAAAAAVLGLIAVVGGLVAVAGRELAQGVAVLYDQSLQGLNQLVTYLATSPLNLDEAQVDA